MKPDWFKMNPSKFMQDSVVDGLNNEELGVLFRLLCRQWIDGSLPDDPTKLCRLARIDTAPNRSAIGNPLGEVLRMFPRCEDGLLRNTFMAQQRAELVSLMEQKSRIGKESIAKRWADRSPIPNLIQDKDSKIKKTTTPRTKKDKSTLVVPDGFHPFLEDICARWPRQSITKEGVQRVTILRPIDIWDRIVTNRQTDEPKTVVNAALNYLDLQDGKYIIGMDNFFGQKRKYTQFVVED